MCPATVPKESAAECQSSWDKRSEPKEIRVGLREARQAANCKSGRGQGRPLLPLGVWGEQEVETGQLFLMKTDVLWT